MNDGIKTGIGQAVADVGEAVVKPVVDEVGKALEEGVSSVVSGPKIKPQDPLVQQQKQAEEAKRLSWARYVIDWYRRLQASQEKVRTQEQQKLAQIKQEETQENQGKQFEVIEQKRKEQQMNAVQLAGRKTEIKRGVGG